jgi:DNA-binding MarR family transcriptional regulator
MRFIIPPKSKLPVWDSKLSLAALGLWYKVKIYPKDISLDQIAKLSGIRKSTLERLVKELVDRGYAKIVEQVYDGDFTDIYLEVFNEKKLNSEK